VLVGVRHREVEPVHFHALILDMGAATDGARDLALSVLADHAGVSAEKMLDGFRRGFRGCTRRMLEVWMLHERLVEQRLVSDWNLLEVSGVELDRLFATKFLTVDDARAFEDEVKVREAAREAESRRHSKKGASDHGDERCRASAAVSGKAP
jgi:hypothetical protein